MQALLVTVKVYLYRLHVVRLEDSQISHKLTFSMFLEDLA